VVNQTNRGASRKAVNAASEEILDSLATSNQVIAVSRQASHDQPSSTPKPVAMPLPPLKPKNTGYRWPRKAAAPISASVSGPAPSRRPARIGIVPLRRSPTRVIAAAFLPPTRSTLVAPGLPEPSLRGSGSPISRQTMMAEEIEPNK